MNCAVGTLLIQLYQNRETTARIKNKIYTPNWIHGIALPSCLRIFPLRTPDRPNITSMGDSELARANTAPSRTAPGKDSVLA